MSLLKSAVFCLFCGFVTLQAQDTPRPPATPAAPRQTIEGIEFRGLRRAPQDTIRALIHNKVGDVYEQEAVRQDFLALWNTKRFDDIQVKTEAGARGGVVLVFIVTETQVNKP
jgi:outer membrane protein insertion porin family